MDDSNGTVYTKIKHGSIANWLATGLFLLTLVLVSSCDSSATTELDSSEELWQSQNLTDYDFILERQCFCPEDWRGPVVVQVRGGEVVSVTYVSSGETAAAEKFEDVDTIEELFGIIRDAYEGKNTFDEKAETVNVSYHPEMGYPLTIFIDVSTMIADEEQGYAIEELAAK